MAKTFKQQVLAIESFHSCELDGRICSDMTLDKYEEHPSCEQCRTDRILTAHDRELDRIAEGMPLHPYPADGVFDGLVRAGYNSGAELQLWDDQAYIQAQKGS